MKRIMFFIGGLLMFLLVGCQMTTRLEEQYIKWTTKDKKIEIIIFDDQGIGRLNESTELYLVLLHPNQQGFDFLDSSILIDPNTNTNYNNSTVLSVRMKNPASKDNPLTMSVTYNNTGYDIFDDLEFELYSEELKNADLDARYFMAKKFTNNEYGLIINQYANVIFTNEATGTIRYQNDTYTIKITYLDNDLFEMTNIDTNELLLSGTYETTFDKVLLTIEFDDVYNGLNQLELSVQKGYLWSFYEA